MAPTLAQAPRALARAGGCGGAARPSPAAPLQRAAAAPRAARARARRAAGVAPTASKGAQRHGRARDTRTRRPPPPQNTRAHGTLWHRVFFAASARVARALALCARCAHSWRCPRATRHAARHGASRRRSFPDADAHRVPSAASLVMFFFRRRRRCRRRCADALPPLRAVAADRSPAITRTMCFPDEPLEQTDPEARPSLAAPHAPPLVPPFCRRFRARP
jgi:hypothetical protein